MCLRADPFVFKLDHPQLGQLIIKGDSKGAQGIRIELFDLVNKSIPVCPHCTSSRYDSVRKPLAQRLQCFQNILLFLDQCPVLCFQQPDLLVFLGNDPDVLCDWLRGTVFFLFPAGTLLPPAFSGGDDLAGFLIQLPNQFPAGPGLLLFLVPIRL